MVLCAKSEDGTTQLLDPPAGAAVGTRLTVAGIEGPAWPANKVKKQKLWEAVQADLCTNAECHATWQGQAILVDGAPVTVTSCAKATIA